jgi:hypothetical protein
MSNDTHRTSQLVPVPDVRVRWFLLFLLAALAVWILFWVALVVLVPTWKEKTQFDVFSAANALFSAFAFGGLIYTVLLQRRDLALQLIELQLTREELKGQKEQLAAQNATLLRQSFETRFFEWLKLHHEIVGAIQYTGTFNAGASRAAFSGFINELRMRYRFLLIQASPANLRDRHPGESEESHVHRLHLQMAMSHEDLAVQTYEDVFKGIQGHVGHYFRNLYNLLKFIDHADLPHREKRFYSNIVRAQLSSYELALLFYNCLHPIGAKFRPLVERYGLLKNMDHGLLLTNELHPHRFYSIGAFEGSPATYQDGS